MPFLYTAPAAGGRGVLRDEDRMVSHGGLLAVVSRLGVRQALPDKPPRMFEHCLNAPLTQILGLLASQAKPTTKPGPTQRRKQLVHISHHRSPAICHTSAPPVGRHPPQWLPGYAHAMLPKSDPAYLMLPPCTLSNAFAPCEARRGPEQIAQLSRTGGLALKRRMLLRARRQGRQCNPATVGIRLVQGWLGTDRRAAADSIPCVGRLLLKPHAGAFHSCPSLPVTSPNKAPFSPKSALSLPKRLVPGKDIPPECRSAPRRPVGAPQEQEGRKNFTIYQTNR